MIKKLITGIRRHPKRFFLAIAFGYSLLWAILEPLFALLEIKTTGYNWYFIASYAFISVIIAFIVSYPKKAVKFDLKNTNTKVEIVFGDLFKSSGYKVISASQYFDSKIGRPVSQNSLQGIFIKKVLASNSNMIDEAVNAQLAGKQSEIVSRTDGNSKKYEIGTTINIDYEETKYFLFALAETDSDCSASCTPSIMLRALEGLWDFVRTEGNGNDINLPLIGDGLSRIGLPQSQLLQLVLISLLKSAKERDLSSTIRIVLLEDTFDKIDLELIKNNWQ